MKEFLQLALDETARLGASYADIRIARYQRQQITSEDERISRLQDQDSLGFGVRAIVNGAWGFASSGRLNREEVLRITRLACDIARASASLPGHRPVRLVSEPPHRATFVTPHEIDPFEVPIDRKSGLLLEINRRLRKQREVKKAEGFMTFKKEHRYFASTEGSLLEMLTLTSAAGYQATAVDAHDARTRSYQPPPRNMGYENVNEADLLEQAERVAEQAVGHLHAKPCPVGVKDLILDPLNLALTIHESVGHATELDRALGMEESLAGRSFATPDKLNRLRYGASGVNFVADNTLPAGLATHGFDDDGVEGQRWHIVEDGMFVGYSGSREVAGEIGWGRSRGSCRADSWSSTPIVRIPNLSLQPGKTPCTPDDLIADTKDGIYIEGMGSFSIDQMRCNFQFGGDCFWEIKNGKKVGMLKNVTYQAITTDFWNSCAGIADERFWVPNGVLNCGKGDPMQIAQMTHGAAPAKFARIKVGEAMQNLGLNRT
jgi:TldD protein